MTAAALRTDELLKLFRKFIHGRSMVVLGVFPADKLPSLNLMRRSLIRYNPKCCCFVANTDSSTQPGKHWVLFMAEAKKGWLKLDYFDSYGMPLLFYTDLYRNCTKLGYFTVYQYHNTKQLQSFDSVLCGHYCFMFAYLRAHSDRSFSSVVLYLQKLGLNTHRRDAALFRLIRSIWGDYKPHSTRRNALHCDQCCCSFR